MKSLQLTVSFICTLVLYSGVAWSESAALSSLDNFFTNITTFKARFVQIVLDENLQELDDGKGTVWVSRPGRFRWDYEQPDAQQIVGDGKKVWIYDVDLEQITVRNQALALGKTPAILLAGSGDLGETYSIEDIGRQGRFDWVNLIPIDEESGFTEIRVGFEDNRLRLMELLDTLGQRTRISFIDLKENIEIDEQTFAFTPPIGVDVIDESEP